MKLIIDIPVKRYKQILSEQGLPNRIDLEKAVAKGVPLDPITDEIMEHTDEKYGMNALGCGTALKILNKHINRN